MATVHWRWMAQDGLDVTGTDDVAGYNVADFFDASLDRIRSLPPNAAYDALVEAYKGPDSEGIALDWTVDGCDRARGRGDDGRDPDDTPSPRPPSPVRGEP